MPICIVSIQINSTTQSAPPPIGLNGVMQLQCIQEVLGMFQSNKFNTKNHPQQV